MGTSIPLASRNIRPRKGASPPGYEDRDVAGEYRRKLGRYLSDLREAAGMAQKEVSDLTGAWHTAVSSYETERGSLPPENYVMMADAFSVDRVEFARTMLRYTNPWLYQMLFAPDDQGLAAELKAIPTRMGRAKKFSD